MSTAARLYPLPTVYAATDVKEQPHLVLLQPFFKPRIKAAWVNGEVVEEEPKEAIVPPGLYSEVRDDLLTLSPIKVSRVALKYASHAYVGIIDSERVPYFFALDSRGLALRKAPDTDETWGAFDKMLDAEKHRALLVRRLESIAEQEEIDDELTEEPQLVIKAIQKKGAGSRGSTKLWFDARGKARYDERPVHEKHVGVVVNDKHTITDALGKKVHKLVAKKAPSTAEELRSALYDICRDLGDDHAEAKTYAGEWMFALHDVGAISLNLDPMDEEESKELLGKLRATKQMGETYFKVQKGLARPVLAKMFQPTGAKLLVDGRPVKVSADAEQACMAYAKRFVVNAGTVKERGKFDKGFHKSLQAMGVPKGEYDFSQFAKKVDALPAKASAAAKSTDTPTPQTHPQLFVVRDGQHVRLADARVPMGNFYTGKDGYGTWARALTEKDLTWNGVPPSGWKGKVVNDPSKRYVMTWTHPDTGEPGYVYPADSVVGAELKKFERAAKLAKHIDGFRMMIFHDAENARDPQIRASALCSYLIDKETFRSGGEQYADGGRFGVGSLRNEHVQIDGQHVVFEFTGKKGVAWRRVVDFTKMPDALAFIKQCKKGKKPDARLWEGDGWRVDDKGINEYLSRYNVDGNKITAKDFRTFHANARAKEMISKLEMVESALDIDGPTMRKLVHGFDPRDKKMKALLAQTFRGKPLRDVLGFVDYHEGKKRLTGLVPTVATHLGHTPSACRNSYIDPVVICNFAAARGWDARTPKEKKHRPDLLKPGSVPKPAATKQISDVHFASIVQQAADAAPADHGIGPRKVFIHHVHEAAQKKLGGMSLDDFKRRLTGHRKMLARADLVATMDPKKVAASETGDDGARFHFVTRS